MAVRPIVAWPDPVLSTPASPVIGVSDVADLAQDMLDTMYGAPGRGLAAPQVGVLQRVFVMDTTWKDGTRAPLICINPEIKDRSDRHVSGPEGCLSIPGVSLTVERSEWVDLEWSDLQGVRHCRRFDGFDAICIQHEYDHLDGIVTFDRVSAVARAEAEKTYNSYVETPR